MKLSQILNGIDAEINGDSELEISGLYHNSKEVKDGGIFFAIPGTRENGAEFIVDAIKKGAKAVISPLNINIDGVTSVKVDDVRKAMSLCACNFYSNPSRDMTIYGVTGTNGKTTTTYMLSKVLEEAGKKVGIIGTNGVFLDGKKIADNLTTPDPIDLQKYLSIFRDNNVDCVCMEVSAHALELQKTSGIMTDIALFTNLTQDHLDFFKNMENYYDAKKKLFSRDMARQAVINYDDLAGRRLFNSCEIPAITYSREKNNPKFYEANIIAKDETHNTSNQTFRVITPLGSENISLNLSGGFNVSNALGVIGAGLLSGIDLKTIKNGLNKLEKVNGRFNTYDVNGVRVIIDYAHTPDGVENILKAAREITDGNLISVFGCGGNRDSSKRHIMGEISASLADYSIVTSDNPRFEKPEAIISDITKNMAGPYEVVVDRKDAIFRALEMARPGDTVAILGKGAEPYIDKEGIKTPYEDRLVIEEFENEIKK